MNADELQRRYQHLRHELDEAYAAETWDARRIDDITEQMLPLERALATAHAAWAEHGAADRPARAGHAPAAGRTPA